MGGHCDYSTPGNRNLSMPLPMEKQKFVPSVFIPRTLVAVHNAVRTASVVMEAQQCVLCIVALHTSPLTIRNTQVFRQSARHFCPILTKFGISQQVIVLVPPQYQISWKISPVGSADTRGQIGNMRFSQLPLKAPQKNPRPNWWFCFHISQITIQSPCYI